MNHGNGQKWASGKRSWVYSVAQLATMTGWTKEEDSVKIQAAIFGSDEPVNIPMNLSKSSYGALFHQNDTVSQLFGREIGRF